MPACWLRKIFILMLTVATAGCGLSNPSGEELYGNNPDGYEAIDDYGGGAYSGGLTGGYDDPYGASDPDVGGYTSALNVRPSAAPVLSGTYGDYGASYGEDAVLLAGASPRPGASAPPVSPVPDESVLSAWVLDVKEPSLWGRLRGQKVVAKVEIENPGSRTLSGRLRVRFTDGGNPTGVIQTRRVTRAPKEKQILTFTAQSSRVDDAEALIETEGPVVGSAPQVRDR